MLYRKLGNTGLSVSVLGFGAMRLPMEKTGDGSAASTDPFGPIDEGAAIKMIDYAVDRGINYYDSAYMYHGGGSETLLGKALKPYRDKVLVATKLPAVLVTGPADFEKFLGEQLKRLGTEYLDVYLLHGLHRESWSKLKEMGILPFLDRVQSEGRARFVGFSFHDDLKVFKEIVDSYDWKLCQIQYNYYDEDAQAGKVGLQYAASKGMGVVIMEPVRGGMLAEPVPEEVEALWNSADVLRRPAEWALRWVWNHSEVSLALSGMSSMDQVVENIKFAEGGMADSLKPKEVSLIREVRDAYKRMFKVGCTGCAYCMPCQVGISIPNMFSLYNDSFVFPHKAEASAFLYNRFLKPELRASACVECGACEEKCPQHIPIREELKNVHKKLSRE